MAETVGGKFCWHQKSGGQIGSQRRGRCAPRAECRLPPPRRTRAFEFLLPMPRQASQWMARGHRAQSRGINGVVLVPQREPRRDPAGFFLRPMMEENQRPRREQRRMVVAMGLPRQMHRMDRMDRAGGSLSRRATLADWIDHPQPRAVAAVAVARAASPQ